MSPRLDAYYEMVRTEHPETSVGNFAFSLQRMFEGVPLEGSNVLDIGAGDGLHGLHTLAAGASRLVALEPEQAGSTSGMQERFDRAASRLGADSAELRRETLQEFEPGDQRFNTILSVSSVNHLDEAACMQLHRDEGARDAYRKLFEKLARLSAPGATLVVTDCSRHNLFARLPVRNPVARGIEWEKHQRPEVWAELLAEAGFQHPRISWSSFNTLRRPGRALLGNRAAAWCFDSGFRLVMRVRESVLSRPGVTQPRASSPLS